VRILVTGYGKEVSRFRSDCAGWESIQDFLVDGRSPCVVLPSQIGHSLAHQKLRDILGGWKVAIPVSVVEGVRTKDANVGSPRLAKLLDEWCSPILQDIDLDRDKPFIDHLGDEAFRIRNGFQPLASASLRREEVEQDELAFITCPAT
jgi:hypothetical protein